MNQFIVVYAILCATAISAFGQDTTKTNEGTIICFFEQQPTFPGGYNSLKAFIKKNLRYPSGTADYSGTIFVGFTVNQDGSISDVEIIKGLCQQCDENTMEVFKKMPRWIPAKENDKSVKSRMIFPVRFEM